MEMTVNRLQYILYMRDMPEKDCTVTALAKRFGVAKSTVSRNIEYLVGQGFIYSDRMALTDYGSATADAYAAEVTAFEKWISEAAPVGDEEGHMDALELAVHLSPGLKKKLLRRFEMRSMLKRPNHEGAVAWQEFGGSLPDGTYPVPFSVYREHYQVEKYFSMADRGFEHPAYLKKTGDLAVISLHAVTMEQRNMMDRLIRSGKLIEMDYYMDGKFLPVTKTGDICQIPAEAFDYVFHAGENLILGSVMIRTCAPIGKQKLHQKNAVLTLMLNLG